MTASFKFDAKSLAEIASVHPELQALCHRALALSPVNFRVLQGIRSAAEQLKAFNGGFSKIRSGGRHQFGCAIDFAVFDPKTDKLDTQGRTKYSQGLYADVRKAFAAASKEVGTPIRTLEHIGDLGHVELPKSYMPNNWKATSKPRPKPAPKPTPPVAPPLPNYTSAEIRDVQTRLIGHGYVQVGGVDGKIGDKTRSAIRDFRAKNGLPVSEEIDAELIEALKNPSAVRPVIAPERSEATVSDLREKGSSIIKGTDLQKIGGGAVGVGIAVKEAKDSGLIDALTGAGDQVTEITDKLTPFQTVLQIFSDWIWLPILIIVGVLIWQAIRIARARLADHKSGNTSVVNLPAKIEGG